MPSFIKPMTIIIFYIDLFHFKHVEEIEKKKYEGRNEEKKDITKYYYFYKD